MTSIQDQSPTPETTRRLAFQFWQERGSPIGSPELDWFRAEEALARARGEETPPLLELAKTIGSTLGSLASLLHTATE